MPDIFGYERKPQANVIATTEFSTITSGGSSNSSGANAGGFFGLGQRVELTYKQAINDIYEIGTSDLFWIGGRPVGDGSLARLVSTKAGFKQIQTQMQLCGPGAVLSISMNAACDGGNAGIVTLSGAVMMAKTYGMDCQNLLVTENIGMRFSKMEEA